MTQTRDEIVQMLSKLGPSTIRAALADILAGDASPEGTLEGIIEMLADQEH